MSKVIDHLRRRPVWLGGATALACGLGITVGALSAGASPSVAGASAPSATVTAPLAGSDTAVSGSAASGTAAAASAAANPAASNPGASTPARHRRRRHVIRGEITAINGDQWTIHTRAGRTVTVTITPSTRFGPRAVPSARKVGAQVIVVVRRQGSTIVALRVGLARTGTASPPTSG